METIHDNSKVVKDTVTDAWNSGLEKTREAAEAIKKETEVHENEFNYSPLVNLISQHSTPHSINSNSL